MNFFRRWWRSVTYKRVLIVYSDCVVSSRTMERVVYALELIRVHAVVLYHMAPEPAVQVYALDHLKPVNVEWLSQELKKVLQPMTDDQKIAEQHTEKFLDKFPPGTVVPKPVPNVYSHKEGFEEFLRKESKQGDQQ